MTQRLRLSPCRGCCGTLAPPTVLCPYDDVCNYYNPLLEADVGGVDIARTGRITVGTPDNTTFTPTVVSHKQKVDFIDPAGFSISRVANLRITPPATGPGVICVPNELGYYILFSIGEFWGQSDTIGYLIEAIGSGAPIFDTNDTLAYVAGAEMEQRFTQVTANNYDMEWFYNGVLLYSDNRNITWIDPFYHTHGIGSPQAGDKLEDIEIDVTPCNACAVTLPPSDQLGEQEYWYPAAASTNGDPQVTPANVLVSSGVNISKVAGGINGDQWEMQGNLGTLTIDPDGILVDLSRDFTISLWFERDNFIGGLDMASKLGNAGLAGNPSSTIEDYLIFTAANTGDVESQLEVFGRCKNGSVSAVHSVSTAAGEGKHLYVFRWLAQSTQWILSLGNSESGTVEHYQFSWGSQLIPNSVPQRFTVNTTEGIGIGRVDQPAVWPCALSDAQVSTLFNGGAGVVSVPSCT